MVCQGRVMRTEIEDTEMQKKCVQSSRSSPPVKEGESMTTLASHVGYSSL